MLRSAICILALYPGLAIAHDHSHTSDHPSHAQEAKKIGLTVGGHITSMGAFVQEDADASTRPQAFFNQTEINLEYRQQASQGFYYGAYIELEADVSEDTREEGVNADKTYLFLESELGRLELGSIHDPGHLMGIDASSIAHATGGVHGDWDRFASFPGSVPGGHTHGVFIHSPSLPLHHEHDTAEDALKISYISPQFNGLQFGISYIPDSGSVGQDVHRIKDGHRDYNDAINGGIRFAQAHGDFSYAVSAMGEFGNAELAGHEDLEAYALGASLNYLDWSLAGSYGDWNKSLTHSSPTNSDAHYWSAGLGYNAARWGISGTYLDSEYQRNNAQVFSLGADYFLLPGLTPFGEVTWFDLDIADSAIADNDGAVTLIGMQLNF